MLENLSFIGSLKYGDTISPWNFDNFRNHWNESDVFSLLQMNDSLRWSRYQEVVLSVRENERNEVYVVTQITQNNISPKNSPN